MFKISFDSFLLECKCYKREVGDLKIRVVSKQHGLGTWRRRLGWVLLHISQVTMVEIQRDFLEKLVRNYIIDGDCKVMKRSGYLNKEESSRNQAEIKQKSSRNQAEISVTKQS